MSIPGRTITCDVHGGQQATFVCQHIVQTVRDRLPRGFFCAQDLQNPRPDAWCSACNDRLVAAGAAWNDESEAFAGVTLLCGKCYDVARQLNGFRPGGSP